MVTIEIDGKQLQVRKGAMVIEAADDAGITIPRFCYHRKLSVAANCRMCLVEVEKVPKPLPACATPVTDGMKIFTRSARALDAQKSVMEFLLINHPLDCPICDQGGECELQDLAMGYGKAESRYHEFKRVVADKDIGPLISTEMTRCIHCTRCVRFGQEIAGIMELGATGRGEHTRIGTYVERAVTSEMSGNVIDLCPVGALTSKPYRYTARPWELTSSPGIAAHDCIGSNIQYKVRRNRVMRVDPRENESINEVWLSDRDRFSYTGLYHEQRVSQPMIKQGHDWKVVDWQTALNYAVEGLKTVMEQKSAEQLGALISPNATSEEHYLLQKLMRALGSNNIDHRLRQQDFLAQDNMPVVPGLGVSIAELEEQDAIFLVGSWVRKDQPIAAHRIRKATKKGAQVMALNALHYDFNFPLAEHLVVVPSDMPVQLAAIAKSLLNLTGKSAPQGLEALLENVDSTDAHAAIARHLSTAEQGIVLMGIQAMGQSQYAELLSLAALIAELAEVKFGFLSDGANTAGACLAGALPHRGVAGATVSPVGKDAAAMLATPLAAYLLYGIEPEYDCADPAQAVAAVSEADFVVTCTSYVTERMKAYADVILPIGLSAEISGSFVNAEGKWQSFTAAVSPEGETRPGWKVLRVLGNLFEVDGFEQASVDEVRNEVQSLSSGASLSTQPKVDTALQLEAAPAGLQRIGHIPIYAADSQVRRAIPLQETTDAIVAAVYLNSETAGKQRVSDGQQVNVQQGAVRAELQVVIDEGVPDNCVFIPIGVEHSTELGAAFGSVELLTDNEAG